MVYPDHSSIPLYESGKKPFGSPLVDLSSFEQNKTTGMTDKDAMGVAKSLQAKYDKLLQESRRIVERNYRRITRLEAALQDAIETIHRWHGNVGWEIYQERAHEMKTLIQALKGGDDE